MYKGQADCVWLSSLKLNASGRLSPWARVSPRARAVPDPSYLPVAVHCNRCGQTVDNKVTARPLSRCRQSLAEFTDSILPAAESIT
jgi:hypothetical protein